MSHLEQLRRQSRPVHHHHHLGSDQEEDGHDHGYDPEDWKIRAREGGDRAASQNTDADEEEDDQEEFSDLVNTSGVTCTQGRLFATVA
jgi:hypothetical protein